MTTKVAIDNLKLEGVASYGNWSNPAGTTVLYLPVESATQLRGGWAEAQAPKIGNDAIADITNFLSYLPIIGKDGLVNGAFAKDFTRDEFKYSEPSNVAGGGIATGALAWTLSKEAPLLCGAPYVSTAGTFGFGEMQVFNGSIYAIDVKTNNIWRWNTNAWQYYHTDGTPGWGTTGTAAAGLGSAPTEICVRSHNGANAMILVGQVTGSARYSTNGNTWSNWGTGNAQHFAVVPKQKGGETIWYSTGRRVTSTLATSRIFDIGTANTNIQRLLYFTNKLLITKPEGLWMIDLDTGIIWGPIFDALKATSTNGRVLITHGGEAWTNFDNKFYHSRDGVTWLESKIGMFDGVGKRSFYGGTVVGADSSLDKLWVVYRVVTSDATPRYRYYVMAHRGGAYGDDWHPVFVSDATSDPAYTLSGLCMFPNQLHFSVGNDVTGYLYTDGEQPLSDSANGVYYGKDVGIWSGWMDFEREYLSKYIKALQLSTYDFGTAGQVKLYYQKWGSATTTAVNATQNGASGSKGSQDNLQVAFDAQSLAQAGITASKIRLLIELANAASPANAWWVKQCHAIFRVTYTPARTFRITTVLDRDGVYGPNRDIAFAALYDGIRGAIQQVLPVKITWQDGNTYLCTAKGVDETVQDTDPDTGKGGRSKVVLDFIEDS